MKLPLESEESFLAKVLQLARLYGWRRAHFRPARTMSGVWKTPVQADGAGFPDLVLVRPGRLIFAELKRQDGKTSESQDAWLAALDLVPGVETYLWRPSDWETIMGLLK